MNVNRWFTTIINQPSVKAVLGTVELCDKVTARSHTKSGGDHGHHRGHHGHGHGKQYVITYYILLVDINIKCINIGIVSNARYLEKTSLKHPLLE